jgi:hypothetical protein
VTSLTWLLPDLRTSYSRKSLLDVTSETRIHQIPDPHRFRNFADFWSQNFAGSWFQDFIDFSHPEIDNRFANRSQLRPLLFTFYQKVSATQDVHQEFFMNVAPSRNWTFRPEDDSRILANPTFRGCKVFAQFPNTRPSGKRVDSEDLIPQKLSNAGKKRHPQNVGVDTRLPKNSQRSYWGSFLKLPPPLHTYK